MEEMLFFISIYSILVFIWSYTYAKRKKKDKATVSFLFFLGIILLWMVLSITNFYGLESQLFIPMQKLYWIVLLNMATVFLYFIYRLLQRKLDVQFYILLILNTLTILLRVYLEMDYTQSNFWRFNEVKLATLMATIFTLPMVWAILLLTFKYKNTKEVKERKSIEFLLYGVTFATIISIISEYFGPIFLPGFTTTSLMYMAILTLVVFLVLAVVKEEFLNVEMEYIYDELFLNSSDGIILVDRNGEIASINNYARKILQPHILEKGMQLKEIIKDYDFNRDETRYEIDLSSGKDTIYLSLSQNTIRIDGKQIMKLLHIIDITEEKIKQINEINILSDKSMKDPLTDLYNRRYFSERFLNEKVHENLTIIFIDIDNFKTINDNYGHLLGDSIIKIAAQSIKDSIRTNEIAIRYGGDEFLIILENIKDFDAYKISGRINDRFKKSIRENGIEESLSLSIGLTRGSKDIRALVEEADLAMYKSKSLGKDRTTIYSRPINEN